MRLASRLFVLFCCGTTLTIPAVAAEEVVGIAGDATAVRYTEQIPGTDVTFEMAPIPGGEFLLGSPADEVDRSGDEGPQRLVRVAPCWIGRCEVTWAEYHAFMATYNVGKALGVERDKSRDAQPAGVARYFDSENLEVDGVTSPTPLYDPDTTYMAGSEPNQPAVTMTQFAAKQYTKWLSGITGREYRLPTEAEWEYAARAGAQTAYSFGDDPAQLVEYAWYDANSDNQSHAVGGKPPNAWGLCDMHGNAAEWVLDAYHAEHYAAVPEGGISTYRAVNWPTRLYPRMIRGGSWFDEAAACRSAARQGSDDPEWNLSDPNSPKSPWWFTEEPATGVGFRVLRSLEPMDESAKKRVWEADVDRLRDDVAERLREGRGARSAANPQLPGATEELRRTGVIE